MTEAIVTSLFIFALAGFLGFEVIRRVPKLLHTPLMALTNALSAIALVAAIIVLSETDETYVEIMCFIAIVASTINVVGGFILTDRMMRMFQQRQRPVRPPAEGEGGR